MTYPSPNLHIPGPPAKQMPIRKTLADDHITIPANLELDPIMDFDFLRKKGIELVQLLASDIWTDYNEHDPGVTILEQLCYALTDIGYRSNFDIEDLLYAKGKNQKTTTDNAFYPPEEILPVAPISVNDYRRLLIDRAPYVKNAWLSFQKSNIQGFEGLCQVKIQIWDDLENSKREETIRQVKTILQAHRNLSQDFESITILETERIGISAEVVINSGEIGEYILAEMVHELENYLNPIVNFYTPEELESAGYSINEYLTGPQPVHGLIIEEELHPLNTEIYISNLYEIMIKVPGVREVKNLVVRQEGKRIDNNVILLTDDRHPMLDEAIYRPLNQRSTLKVFRDHVEIPMDFGQVQQLLDAKIAKDRKGYNLKMRFKPYESKTTKKLEEIEAYVSLQNYFPQVYGLGEFGLSPRADRKRKAQVHQLKGYLFFFEQILSNHLSQLANIRHLFSIDDASNKSYHSQFPFHIPAIEVLVKSKGKAQAAAAMEKLVSDLDPFLDRRNRFLDHLLARFGEQYQNELWIKLNNLMEDDKDDNVVKREMIQSKCQFLQNYIELSRDRGKGFNYTLPSWGNENVSCFKKRICLQLNIDNHQNRSLTGALAKARFAASFSPKSRESHSTPNTSTQFSLQEMLYFGISRDHYNIHQDAESGLYQLKFNSKKRGEQVLYRHREKNECQKKLRNFISLLQQVNNDSEGFIVVENILLRPKLSKKWVLTLLDESQNKLLVSSQSSSYDQQQFLSEDLLMIGTEYSSYELYKIEDQYLITLKNAINETVMVSPQRVDLSTAYDSIKSIMKLLESVKTQEPSRLKRLVLLEEESIDGLDNIYSRFYSNRISLILPSWPARFQNEDFRNLFYQTVIENIPVHLAVDYYWMGFSDMTKFENLYQLWLEEKAKPKALDKRVDELSFQLAEMLSKHQSKKSVQKETTSNAAIHHPDISGSYHLLSCENLQIVEGIGAKIEKLLQQNGIADWDTLAHTSSERLQDILNEAGPAFRIHNPHNWSDQAWLAHKGDWTSLVTFQKLLNSHRDKDGEMMESPAKVERLLAALGPQSFKEEDLQIIKGIGPRVEAVLKAAGITTLHLLAKTEVTRLKEILEQAGLHLLAQPESWPQQARDLY